MKTFLCNVGEMSPGLLDQAAFGDWMTDFFGKSFAYGSAYDTQSSDFDLAFARFPLGTSFMTGRASTVLQLQKALQEMLGKTPAHVLGVDEIGLLFAGHLKNQGDVFGMMFDSPIADPSSAEPPYNTTPRQGCAVFLDAIAQRRPNAKAFSREVLFTAMHELGHVFNLWHLESRPSFMASSSPGLNEVRDDTYFRFIGDPGDDVLIDQRHFLSQCSAARTVHPGGTEFGKRDPQGPKGIDPAGVAAISNRLEASRLVALEIKVHEQEFWPFEPVELDITACVGKGKPSVRISDVFDPGYDCFKIWIEDNHGWRRRYRSPVRYCHNFQSRQIDHDKPFRRDIPIFRQGGGLTFPYSGEYTVQIEMLLPKKKSIHSNKIHIRVLEPGAKFKTYREKRRLIGDLPSQSLLYYKHDNITQPQLQRLKQAIKVYGKSHTGGLVSYTLAKSYSQKLARARRRVSARERDIVKRSFAHAGEHLKSDSHSYSKAVREMKDWDGR